MDFRQAVGIATAVTMIALVSFLLAPAALALQSENFIFDETSIGAGGLIQSSSPNFQGSGSALGDISVGNSASENFQIEQGSQTTDDPALTFAIDDINASLGELSSTTTATATAKFSIINYTSYGYIVHVAGTPLKNGDHEISPLLEASDPVPGTDQFGLNLVANTIPESIGQNPDSDEFGFGEAAPNYDESNKYRFVSGDTIAFAPKSSGKTTYTISYIVNVEPLTPGGKYTSNQTLIVTGTY